MMRTVVATLSCCGQSCECNSKWENLEKVVQKAKDACENAGEKVEYHFPDVRKMIKLGKGAEEETDDILLTRYACYLIAQNGDSCKEEIAFAQNYFAVQSKDLKGQMKIEKEHVDNNLAVKNLPENI